MFQRISIPGVDKQTELDVNAILYGIYLIRRETGFGTLCIDVHPEKITEMRAEQKIKPQYISKSQD